MNGHNWNGQRIVVEKAGERRSARPRKGPQSDDKCFNCGERGHWLANKGQRLRNKEKTQKPIFQIKLQLKSVA